MAVYIHSTLLMLFGAVLVEAGIKITSIYFWLLVVILFGILLTYDMITRDVENNEDDGNKKT